MFLIPNHHLDIDMADPLAGDASPAVAPTKVNAGILAHFRDQVRAHLTTDVELNTMLRQTAVDTTFGQAASWYLFALKTGLRVRGMEKAVLNPVLAFLEFVVPLATVIRAKGLDNEHPANPNAWARECILLLD